MATAAPISYVPQPINSSSELSALLSSPLAEIRRTSVIKPHLDLLNEIAFHQQRWAEDIVRLALEAIEQERVADRRLALFYLFDTFCKNRRIASLYRRLLAPLIAAPFVSTYKYASELTKRQMDKLLSAWRSNGIFDSAVLDGIDARLKEVESGAGGKRTADVLGDSDVAHKVSATDTTTTTTRKQRERSITIKCELCCGRQRWLIASRRVPRVFARSTARHVIRAVHNLTVRQACHGWRDRVISSIHSQDCLRCCCLACSLLLSACPH